MITLIPDADDPELMVETVTKPPSRWMAWFIALDEPGTVECLLCGSERPMKKGQLYDDCCETFPSAEIAETVSRSREQRGRFEFEIALPVGDQP